MLLEDGTKTLPDYLAPGLDIVFIGLNPGSYSAQVGHYFARPTSGFWQALQLSGLVPSTTLSPEEDRRLLKNGVGFTDVVKRPSRGASDLRVQDFRRWAPVLREKLLRFRPRIACFHGVTAYRSYLRYAEDALVNPTLGEQPRTIDGVRVFVSPNPSPANRPASLPENLASWYRRLGALRDSLKGDG